MLRFGWGSEVALSPEVSGFAKLDGLRQAWGCFFYDAIHDLCSCALSLCRMRVTSAIRSDTCNDVLVHFSFGRLPRVTIATGQLAMLNLELNTF